MKIKILGSGQDAGIPQGGCYCSICVRARKYKKYRRLGPSVSIYDKKRGFNYLIDASPDFKYQIDMIKKESIKTERKGKIPVTGILLTHAHLGHFSGLAYLGKEAIDEKNLPVYCTAKMNKFISNNYPCNLLIKRKNISIKNIFEDEEFSLTGFKCRAIQVPHRNEIADTVGFVIKSTKKLIYVPDIDYWTNRLIEEINNADIALIDGTFFSKSELSRFKKVPHPPIQQTVKVLHGIKAKIYFTHINHTNVINNNDKEKQYIKKKGFYLAYDGLTFEI